MVTGVANPDGADRPQTSSAETGNAAQERLMAAAIELMAEKPPAQITVRMIADRAGVQHSLITRHFGSRDTLLALAVGQALVDLADEIERAEDLDAAIDALVDSVRSTPVLATATAVLIAQTDRAAAAHYPLVDALTRHLRDAGVPPPAARHTAVCLSITVFGWAAAESWWLAAADQADDPAIARRILKQGIVDTVSGAQMRSGPDGGQRLGRWLRARGRG